MKSAYKIICKSFAENYFTTVKSYDYDERWKIITIIKHNKLVNLIVLKEKESEE